MNKIRWIPDDEAPVCMACAKEFSLGRRRHHCRLCGHVVCGTCSKHKVRLASGVIRVCDDCFVSFAPDGGRRDFTPVGSAGALNGGGYGGRRPSQLQHQQQQPKAPSTKASKQQPAKQQTPAEALLGAPREPTPDSYETYQTADDATAANAHRQVYESPNLAENPDKCCCVIC